MHLRDAFALDVGALKCGIELASLNNYVGVFWDFNSV